MDVLSICEVQWIGSSQLVSNGKTINYSGYNSNHARGVGIALVLIEWNLVSDQIISTCRHSKITVVQVYEPTEDADDVKDSSKVLIHQQ